MPKMTSSPTIAAALLGLSLTAAPAQAQGNRTWVSGHGVDSGACTFTAPCATFAFAENQTTAGGEIDVIDSANYGPVVINKALSIINDGGGIAGIGATAQDAVAIGAGATDTVRLRGLTITGVGTLDFGIRLFSGGTLIVENCVIRNYFNSGMNISPYTSSSFTVLEHHCVQFRQIRDQGPPAAARHHHRGDPQSHSGQQPIRRNSA